MEEVKKPRVSPFKGKKRGPYKKTKKTEDKIVRMSVCIPYKLHAMVIANKISPSIIFRLALVKKLKDLGVYQNVD